MQTCSKPRRASLPHAPLEHGGNVAAKNDAAHLVQLGGLEPPTSWSTAKRSNQLSYSCTRLRSRGNLRAPPCFDKVLISLARLKRVKDTLWRAGNGSAASTLDEKSPGDKPGLNATTNAGRETQATFLKTLPKLSLTGSAESVATFCAIAASSLD